MYIYIYIDCCHSKVFCQKYRESFTILLRELDMAPALCQSVPAALGAGLSVGRGRTPLHKAAYRGHSTVAEVLLAKGAAADATDGIGHDLGNFSLDNR